jgi:hypothetical protein
VIINRRKRNPRKRERDLKRRGRVCLKNRENVGGYVSLFGGWIWIGNLEERMNEE